MVNNSNTTSFKKRTTEHYKLITETLADGLKRLEADKAYFLVLQKSKNSKTYQQGVNGVKATTIQIQRQKAAIRLDQRENEQAFRRGEIFKFW